MVWGWRAAGRAAREREVAAGEIIRRLHWQAWRDAPAGDGPAAEVSLGELVSVLPVLIESGSVGIVWPRLRDRFGTDTAVGAVLESAYQSQVEHNARVEREIARVVSRLHEAGVQPVLIKGLSMARLYPAGIVRTAGDIDLVVRDAEYARAEEVLADGPLSLHGDPARGRGLTRSRGGDRPLRAERAIEVDLHAFSRWGEAASEDFFRDAREVALRGSTPTGVLVPCREDHLRALCLHFLRHAAVRPLRLCDIGLLMESGGYGVRADPEMDWERVLRGSARQREEVVVALGLARDLLGAADGDAPAEVPDALLDALPAQLPSQLQEWTAPGWLHPAVMRQWGANPTVPGPLLEEILGNPRGIVHAFRRRWPDPITATLRTGAPFNDVPRLPVAIAAYAGQMGYYAKVRLPRQLRDRHGR